jgi:hypothetical protein
MGHPSKQIIEQIVYYIKECVLDTHIHKSKSIASVDFIVDDDKEEKVPVFGINLCESNGERGAYLTLLITGDPEVREYFISFELNIDKAPSYGFYIATNSADTVIDCSAACRKDGTWLQLNVSSLALALRVIEELLSPIVARKPISTEDAEDCLVSFIRYLER